MFQRILTVFLIIFLGKCVLAQKPDTLFVYENVYITDTIWVEEELPLHDTPQYSTLYSIRPEVFSLATATIPKNCIYVEKNQKQPEMKKIVLLGLTMIALNSTGKSQSEFKENLSFFVKGNLAGLNYDYLGGELVDADNSLIEVHGEIRKIIDSDWNEMAEAPTPSFGFGFAFNKPLNCLLSLEPKLMYIQKGSRFKNSRTSPVYTNLFHFLSSDFVFELKNTKKKGIQPLFYTGLRGDYLIWNKIEYDINGIITIDDNSFNQRNQFKDFKRFNWGLISGFGIEKPRNWYLQLEMNNDLGYLVKSDILKVRNLVFSMNCGIYLDKIPKYKLVKESNNL